MDPRGKLALVTGAGREGRIGAGLAGRLAREGADVIIHYRSDEEEARRVADHVGQYGKVELVRADLSDYRQVAEMFQSLTPEIVVNNASVFRKSSLPPELPFQEYMAHIDSVLRQNAEGNLLGPLRVTEAAIHKLLGEQKQGVIVFIGDASIYRGFAYPVDRAIYAMTKSYMEHLDPYTREYGKRGLRFGAVLNGAMLPTRNTRPEAIEVMKRQTNVPDDILDPWLGVEPVADEMMHFVRSDHLNGTRSLVDGGRVPWSPDE